MLTAHMDVVPIAESENEWIAPPFSGEIIDGFIYSRGTIDDKNMVMAILEAVSFALESGFEFERTLYLAFGHDEEVGGFTGAKRIGELLGKRGVELEYLLDEGTFIIDDVVPKYLLDSPVAISLKIKKISLLIANNNPICRISVAEKGIVTLNLSVTTEGGHSSMPPRENSIVILSQAIERLHNQLQPNLFGSGPERQFVEHLAPYLPFYARVIAANLWLFRPLVAYAFGRKPSTDSICRTTTAVTKFKSGIKDNVVSPKAEACVNHRIHPADSVKDVLDRDIRIIGDSRIKTTVKVSLDPSPVSPSDETAFGYHAIAESLNQVFSDIKLITAPSTMVANTDTRHYWHLTHNIYRFSPSKMKMADLKRFHGVNERIGVKNYEQTVNFYYHLILNSNSERLRIVEPHEEL
ncbi:DgyrCDS14104 [Dimorphilus gyrociliatus]|uniref:DgyrCDS14104 n=1 Tax=Dimorphilus gyrociliatus TaxID=2664684 RepID=A0A7I8WCV5_9ANNE|nr:DgyrCDS14104 [Dimorphilus gyrociliatus]